MLSMLDRPASSIEDEILERIDTYKLGEKSPWNADVKIIHSMADLLVRHPPIAPKSKTASKALPPRIALRNLRERNGLVHRIKITGVEIALPLALVRVAEAIESSRALLDLEPDWDGTGNPGITTATWHRAATFLARGAEAAWTDWGDRIPAPLIFPGPNGSIDLDWVLPQRSLLLNFPSSSELDAGFYGDDGDGNLPLEGKLDPGALNSWIFAWLVGR